MTEVVRRLHSHSCAPRGTLTAASPNSSWYFLFRVFLPTDTAWQATSRGRPRRRCTEIRTAQVSIRMSSRMGMALRIPAFHRGVKIRESAGVAGRYDVFLRRRVDGFS